MSSLLFGIISYILSFFEWTNGEYFYFYYNAVLLSALVVGTLLVSRSIAKGISAAGKKRWVVLALILVAFIVTEIALVQPTQQLYNDEYIHMSVAKSILVDHYAGICSFMDAPHCVNGTAGLLQQPAGWPTMLSVSFLLFGVSFSSGYGLVLLLSCISIVLVFYIAFMILKDGDAALIASALFAFTPLFLTFSRSLIVDTPELTVFLLAIALLLTYIKERKPAPGVVTCVAIAYTLTMKVDAVLILPVALTIFLAMDWKRLRKMKRRDLWETAGLIALLVVIIIPQIIFMYISWTNNTFGASPGQARISLSNLVSNAPSVIAFWLGGYGSIITPSGWQTYNLEFPLAYTLFALIGAFLLLRRKRSAEAALLLLWFAFVFVFYASYYGGGALYGAGDDIRYYMLSFPAIAILASAGISGIVGMAREKRRGRRKAAALKRKKLMAVVALLLIAFMVTDLLFEIGTVVMKSPQNIYPFSAERFQQQIIDSNYTIIPNGCYVLTYEPPLWNVLNVSNIYADWFFIPAYKGPLLNLSHGCLYFEYSLDCVINTGGYGYDNTTPGCTKILDNFTMVPVISAPNTEFGWNYTFTINKITGYKNGTSLYP